MTGICPRLTSLLTVLACLGVAVAAHAQGEDEGEPPEAAAPEPVDPKVAEARRLYQTGMRFVRDAQWGEALNAFEQSSRLRPHPLTTYNVGACERARGRYTRARVRFQQALREHEASAGLPASVVDDARGFVAEIDRLLARVTIEIDPPHAGVAVDGRPLSPGGKNQQGKPRLVAGISAPGPGRPAPARVFELVVDPGAHVITLSRKGYGDALVNRTFAPGYRGTLRLELERLPATLHVSSNETHALVTVDGKDVGPVPVDVLRPAGSYRVEVAKDGYVPYAAQVRVNAGEEATLRATLVLEETPITARWWFWTAASVVVAGAALGTYYATRTEPEPQRPPLDGGTLRWAAPIP